MGTSLHQWVVHSNFQRALSLLKYMDQRKMSQKSIRHSILQAQVYNKSNSDTWVCGHKFSAATHNGTQRKTYDSYGRKWNRPTQKLDSILKTKTKQFSRGCHQIIWSQQKSKKSWVGICLNNKRNVLIYASRTPSTKIVIRAIGKTRICKKLNHPGIMETQMVADLFHLGIWRLWRKVPS